MDSRVILSPLYQNKPHLPPPPFFSPSVSLSPPPCCSLPPSLVHSDVETSLAGEEKANQTKEKRGLLEGRNLLMQACCERRNGAWSPLLWRLCAAHRLCGCETEQNWIFEEIIAPPPPRPPRRLHAFQSLPGASKNKNKKSSSRRISVRSLIGVICFSFSIRSTDHFKTHPPRCSL